MSGEVGNVALELESPPGRSLRLSLRLGVWLSNPPVIMWPLLPSNVALRCVPGLPVMLKFRRGPPGDASVSRAAAGAVSTLGLGGGCEVSVLALEDGELAGLGGSEGVGGAVDPSAPASASGVPGLSGDEDAGLPAWTVASPRVCETSRCRYRREDRDSLSCPFA